MREKMKLTCPDCGLECIIKRLACRFSKPCPRCGTRRIYKIIKNDEPELPPHHDPLTTIGEAVDVGFIKGRPENGSVKE